MVKETNDIEYQVTKHENTSTSKILQTNPDPNSHTQKASLRSDIGKSFSFLSNLIEDNIVFARLAGKASIVFLTAYGLYKTPIFFRYRRVSDIPAYKFTRRKTVHGRIVGIVQPDFTQRMSMNNGAKPIPITCLVRHLSPMGRLMNKPAFEFLTKNSPSIGKYTNVEDAKDLLKVEIAGIQSPPFYFASSTTNEGVNEWLQGLADQKARISCQLISRRIVDTQEMLKVTQQSGDSHHQRKYGISQPVEKSTTEHDPEMQHIAVCKVSFRPSTSIFQKDLASSLVAYGRANVAPGMHIDIPGRPTVDGSMSLEDAEKDVQYIDKLSELEYKAVKSKTGMWSIESIRSSRPDLVEFAKEEETATWWKKIWNKFRDR
jgi:hypothetical protein